MADDVLGSHSGITTPLLPAWRPAGFKTGTPNCRMIQPCTAGGMSQKTLDLSDIMSQCWHC